MTEKNIRYEITNIEYCPGACGQPHIVTVKKIFEHNGEEREKESVCYLFMNHIFRDGRFEPIGDAPYYQKNSFTTPIKSFVASNGIGEFVAAEFERMFREQRAREGW